jgi:hypothetical protein
MTTKIKAFAPPINQEYAPPDTCNYLHYSVPTAWRSSNLSNRRMDIEPVDVSKPYNTGIKRIMK